MNTIMVLCNIFYIKLEKLYVVHRFYKALSERNHLTVFYFCHEFIDYRRHYIAYIKKIV